MLPLPVCLNNDRENKKNRCCINSFKSNPKMSFPLAVTSASLISSRLVERELSQRERSHLPSAERKQVANGKQ